jgi:hypothetical protein
VQAGIAGTLGRRVPGKNKGGVNELKGRQDRHSKVLFRSSYP